MSENDGITVKLHLSESERKKVQRRAEELREQKVESLRTGYGDRQAEKVDSALEGMNEAEYVRYLVAQDLKEHGYADR